MTYSIIDIADISKVDFNEIFQTSIDTLRYSVDETQFIIKYDLIPSFIDNDLVEPLQVLSYLEALELMSTEDWTIYENN